MNKKDTTNSIVKGLVAGAVIGTASYMMSNSGKKAVPEVKKNVTKAVKSVGGAMENMAYMMK